MLTAVHVFNPQQQTLVLPFEGPSEFVIKEIEGLGPVKADIFTTPYAAVPGEVLQGSKAGMRNIVVRLGYNPSYQTDDPYGDLRRALYRYFTPQMETVLHFHSTSLETVRIAGIVESFEPTMFSEEPEVTISILCPNPNFRALQLTHLTRTGKGLIVAPYLGTAPSGFRLTVRNMQISSSLTSYPKITIERLAPLWGSNPLRDETFLDFRSPALTPVFANHAFDIVTVRGSRAVRWKPMSAYTTADNTAFVGTSLLGFSTGWAVLAPGQNNINVDLVSGYSPSQTDNYTDTTALVDLRYYNWYEGL